MNQQPENAKILHVFLASPHDLVEEREAVRKFFRQWNLRQSQSHVGKESHYRLDVLDSERCAAGGDGTPQDLVNAQLFDTHADSLVLCVGLMATTSVHRRPN